MAIDESGTRGPERYAVEIDQVACVGHGQCEFVAPELFRIEESGRTEYIGADYVDGPPSTLLQQAISACPERAIRLAAAASGSAGGSEE